MVLGAGCLIRSRVIAKVCHAESGSEASYRAWLSRWSGMHHRPTAGVVHARCEPNDWARVAGMRRGGDDSRDLATGLMQQTCR